MSADSVPSSKTNIFQSKLIYCRHFRTYSRCAMFDLSDTVFRRRNVTRRRISNTVLQPRYSRERSGLTWGLPIGGFLTKNCILGFLSVSDSKQTNMEIGYIEKTNCNPPSPTSCLVLYHQNLILPVDLYVFQIRFVACQHDRNHVIVHSRIRSPDRGIVSRYIFFTRNKCLWMAGIYGTFGNAERLLTCKTLECLSNFKRLHWGTRRRNTKSKSNKY
jgi:hypothetical protein